MKISICCFLFLIGALYARAQQETAETVNRSVFLLPEFVNGKVLFLNGGTQAVKLNYNLLFEQMIFQQNGTLLALDQVNTVDTVYLDSMKFVPVDTFFYEVEREETVLPLYMRHHCVVTNDGAATPFGGTSRTGAVQQLSNYRLGVATPYQLAVPDNYMVNNSVTYCMMINHQITAIKSAKQVALLYPGNEKKIRGFIKENRVDFNKKPAIEQLLWFLATLHRADSTSLAQ